MKEGAEITQSESKIFAMKQKNHPQILNVTDLYCFNDFFLLSHDNIM